MILHLIFVLVPALQEPAPQQAPSTHQDPARAQEPEKKLKEWPTLQKKAKAKKEVTRLYRTRSAEDREAAEAYLVALGPGVVPLLIEALGKQSEGEQQELIMAVLDKLLGPEHSQLVGREFEHKKTIVRCWALRQASYTPDPALRSGGQARWTALQEQGDKADPEEIFCASLLLLSTGDRSKFEPLFERVEGDYKRVRAELVRVFSALPAEDLTRRFCGLLTSAPTVRQRALLRLIGICGEPSAGRYLGPFLDSTNNELRIAAINACRAIFDDAPPLQKLSVFEAIERAQRWKSRL